MKRRLLIYLFFTFSLFSFAGNADIDLFCDSIMRKLEKMPTDTSKLSHLLTITDLYQYPPYHIIFATRLYEEAVKQNNLFYENMGAYYLAACYDKKHEADSLNYWVSKLEGLAPKIGKYDYYLEQKAAISRVYSSKQMVEKAVYVAKEVLAESQKKKSNNGIVAACNSLGCAYSVSNRPEQARQILLIGYKACTQRTKLGLRLDILSRLGSSYGNTNQGDSLLFYLDKMDGLLQNAVMQKPEGVNNWCDVLVDCQIKYVRYYMNISDYKQAELYLNKAKKLLNSSVDPIYWLNVQLVELQYLTNIKEYDKSIALIDEVAPLVEKDYVSTYTTLIYYKALNQRNKGDLDGGVETLRFLLHKQDSLNLTFTTSQLEQMKDIYHIDELLMERQKIANLNYMRAVLILILLLGGMTVFYIYTKRLSKKIVLSEKAAAEAAALSNADNMAKERLKLEISHDIRTPLNAVVGFSEILAEEAEGLDEGNKQEYNKIIQENANQLLEYVNNILELSRLESGKIQYKMDDVELIGQIKTTLSALEGIEGNKLKATLLTELGAQWIRTDKDRLDIFLYSLLYSSSETDYYETTIILEKPEAKSVLWVKIINTPLAKERFENKSAMIRNEINAHFIHHFGGFYKVDGQAKGGPTVIFTYPLA